MTPSLINLPGIANPWSLALLFLGASALMIWRLEQMSRSGVEGTVLGTLVMPYCSGIGNLIFVFVVARQQLPGEEVMVNCLVNNITNMTLCIGLPAIFWGASLWPASQKRPKPKRRVQATLRLNKLSMLLTLLAVLFFTGTAWALGGDGQLNRGDGLVLIGLFLFWQCFQVFDVLKSNVRENRTLPWTLALDLVLLLIGGYGVYVSIEGLVAWLTQTTQAGFFRIEHLGWLSGWLMVVPNAGLALYYGWKRQPEVIYTSQVGDGHICIPLCIGISALLNPMPLPPFFQLAVVILVVSVFLHGLVVASFGQLPKLMGWLLTAIYGWFLYRGLIS
jgi:cation:H+ antiporter